MAAPVRTGELFRSCPSCKRRTGKRQLRKVVQHDIYLNPQKKRWFEVVTCTQCNHKWHNQIPGMWR